MSDEKYLSLISRYLSNDLSVEEIEELLALLGDDSERADLLKELQITWDLTKNYPEDFNVDTRAGWLKLQAAIEVQQHMAVAKSSKWYKWLGLAVSILFVALAGLLSYQHFAVVKSIKVNTLRGQHKEIVLPDGSRVWLNENSSLTYTNDFNRDKTRNVKLEGEAFFDVTKNPEKVFIIETAETVTQVMGTSFNVKQDPEGSIKVAVVTGKVSFKSQENPKQELMLLPGEAGVIMKEGYTGKFKLENTNFLFWKEHNLTFDNATLSEVFKTLESCYQVKFRLNNEELLKRCITTSFKQTSLNEVIVVLKTLLDLKIEKSDSVYVVGKNGN